MVKTPLFPPYQWVQSLMKVLQGKSVKDFLTMQQDIWDLRGTPQDPVDWKKPDVWIGERLDGTSREFASYIWNASNKQNNPRHLYGPKFLIDGYDLLDRSGESFQITEIGHSFLQGNFQEFDKSEGLIYILYQVSLKGKGKRSDFVDDWKNYLIDHSNYRKPTVINDSLTRRLRNLKTRGLIHKEGVYYQITSEGEKYLSQLTDKGSIEEEITIDKDIAVHNQKQKARLLEKLKEMDPFAFEHTIKDLLEAMDYEDVEVTKRTNDKGVDIVGSIQKGISTVKDVIQAKRNTSGSVGRKVLDALRGSLHRFEAFQGTIITTSEFSKGARDASLERGAAPITLINGSKLVELMIEYEVGFSKRKVTLFSVDEEYFEDQLQEEDTYSGQGFEYSQEVGKFEVKWKDEVKIFDSLTEARDFYESLSGGKAIWDVTGIPELIEFIN